MTLNLLLHVLAREDRDTVLGRCALYRQAVQTMLQADAFRARLLGEGEPRVIYVVNREGVRNLVLQGCQLESRTIACHLKYRR